MNFCPDCDSVLKPNKDSSKVTGECVDCGNIVDMKTLDGFVTNISGKTIDRIVHRRA